MRKVFIGIFVLVSVLSSCSKEGSSGGTGGGTGGGGTGPGSGSGGSVTSTGLLAKAVEREPITGDSSVAKFTWDASGAVVTFDFTGPGSSKYLVSASRAANGRINKLKEAYSPASNHIDSIVYGVRYVSGTFRIDNVSYTVYRNNAAAEQDSMGYTYNTDGRIAQRRDYSAVGGSGYMQQGRVDFTYDASGNLLKQENYVAGGGGAMSLSSTYTYTYNTHLTPFSIGDIAFISKGELAPYLAGKNELANASEAGSGFAFSGQTYNADNKPTVANVTYTGGALPTYSTTITYTYQ